MTRILWRVITGEMRVPLLWSLVAAAVAGVLIDALLLWAALLAFGASRQAIAVGCATATVLQLARRTAALRLARRRARRSEVSE